MSRYAPITARKNPARSLLYKFRYNAYKADAEHFLRIRFLGYVLYLKIIVNNYSSYEK